MTNVDYKEMLFQNFYSAASHSFSALECQFGITGVLDQVFGVGSDDEQAKSHLRSSNAWATLSDLFDYAIDGLIGNDEPDAIVIDGSDVLHLVTSEDYQPSGEWRQIVAMGDGRFALDEGESVPISKIALLAKVDIRTVRNAVSSGELVSNKTDGEIYIENASARKWLRGRKGFKPTILNQVSEHLSLSAVGNPAEFGAFLVAQRNRIGINTDNLVDFHPSVDIRSVSELEAGVFSLPLDAVFPLANFYQLGRKEFLECVMRTFFYEELEILVHESSKSEGEDECQ